MSLKFDFIDMVSYFQSRYKTNLYKDVLHIYDESWDVFLFSFGAVVFWNVNYDIQNIILDQTKRFHLHALVNRHEDIFTYVIDPDVHLDIKIAHDELVLADESPLSKLALSFAIAQSTNLSSFEEDIDSLIKKTDHIPNQLKEMGSIAISSKEISKLRGEVLEMKSLVNFHFNMMDNPEFFREYPEYERVYIHIARYLEIQKRVDIFNKKISMLETLLDVLGDEQKHRHSSWLEWIVIVLILLEILMSLMDKVRDYIKNPIG